MSLTINFTGLRITDPIRALLSTSAAAYDAAAVDSYVQVTLAEFDSLANLAGATGFGLKRADPRWNLSPGANAYTSSMFRPNTTLAGLYPFAFMTKLEPGATQLVQIASQQNTVGAVQQVSWTGSGITVVPTATNNFFVMKRPTKALAANTNISVDGFYNGWGSTTGGSGLENVVTGIPSTTSANDNIRTGLAIGTVTAISSGTPDPAHAANYRILLAPKSW